MRNAMLLVMGVMPMLWTFCPLAPVRPAVAGEDGTAGQTPKVERYYPDKLPNDWPDGPSRPPVDRQVVHARKIVLYGPDCVITIDAAGERPGILMKHRRSGESLHLLFTDEGKALVGVGVAGRMNYAAAMFRDRRSRQGILQLDDGRGTHVFTGPERYSFPANR